MTPRRLVSFCLSFLLILPPVTASAAGPTLGQLSFQKAFLLDLKDLVAASYDLNLVRIKFLGECLARMSDQDFSAVKIKEGTHRPWLDCNDGVAQMRENTRIKYPRVRRSLLLSQLTEAGNLYSLLVNLHNNMQLKALKKPEHVLKVRMGGMGWGLGIENPLVSFLSSDLLPAPAWTEEELSGVARSAEEGADKFNVDNLNKLLHESCAQIAAKINANPFKLDYTFCGQMRLVYSKEQHGLSLTYDGSLEDIRQLTAQVERAKSFLPGQLRGHHNRWEQEYLATVQLNPYVGLVTSATPSRQDFIVALRIMAGRAQQTVEEFTKVRKEKKLDDPHLADPQALLKLMQHLPLAQKLVDSPGVELKKALHLRPMTNLQEIFDELSSEHNFEELKRVGKIIAVGVAVNMACMIPFARIGKSAGSFALKLAKLEKVSDLLKLKKWGEISSAVFTPVCFSITGIAVNMGMLYEAQYEYAEIYDQVFGSISDETLMRQVSELSDKEREVFWSAATVLMGTGVVKFGVERLKKMILGARGL
ncbi:MAG: hypothetical protein AB7N80_11305 [Bdellovibrionales bacterium]